MRSRFVARRDSVEKKTVCIASGHGRTSSRLKTAFLNPGAVSRFRQQWHFCPLPQSFSNEPQHRFACCSRVEVFSSWGLSSALLKNSAYFEFVACGLETWRKSTVWRHMSLPSVGRPQPQTQTRRNRCVVYWHLCEHHFPPWYFSAYCELVQC
jgi:hypothetical protein